MRFFLENILGIFLYILFLFFWFSIRQETEDIFRQPVLLQFFTSLMIFAMTGFQATVRAGGSGGAVLIYFYCGCIFCQLFVYCWFGNEVFEQVGGIFKASQKTKLKTKWEYYFYLFYFCQKWDTMGFCFMF